MISTINSFLTKIIYKQGVGALSLDYVYSSLKCGVKHPPMCKNPGERCNLMYHK